MDTKFSLLGSLLLVAGVVSIWGYFAYPAYFYGVGLAGLLAMVFHFFAVSLGNRIGVRKFQ